ncbi:hypothetical protein PybrP1_007623 [[Pythium] brassicae (nom. inval.)]|nr:hypothetical protein PybrP1_007623 [[Pythium] brassicae (nom. inval.)]
MDEPRMFAPGWHRKWLLLLAALAVLFLSRFRLMGWLVSQLATFQLAKLEPLVRAEVRVRLVLLRPLQLVHVEVKSGGDWALLVTRITVHSRLGEFFRSFGQTKIWVLEVDEVVGELRHLDEPVLRGLLQRAAGRKQRETAAAPREATSAIGFLRFVDFRVARLQLQARCFGTVSELRCRALSVGITDVLVKENVLSAKLQVASVFARSYRQELGSLSDDDVIHDGVSLDYPSLCVVADLQLTDQRLVGYTLFGAKDERVRAQLSTSFLEFVVTTRLELIRNGLLPALSAPSLSSSVAPQRAAALAKEVTNMNVSVVVVHEVDGRATHPLQFDADITSLSVTESEIPLHTPLDNAASACGGVRLEGRVSCVSVATGRAFEQKVLSLTDLEIDMTRTQDDRGRAELSVRELEGLLSPQITQFGHSLGAFVDGIKDLTRELTLAKSGDLLTHDRQLPRDQSTPLGQPSQIEWDVTANIASWKSRAVAPTILGAAEEIATIGGRTTVATKVLHPVPSRQKRYDVRVEKVQVDATTALAGGRRTHSAVLLGADFAFIKESEGDGASSATTVDAKLCTALVNCPSDGDVTRAAQFPAALMKDVSIRRHDKRTHDAMDTELSLTTADARIEWSHRTHAAFLKEWSAMMALVDTVDAMVSPPKPVNATAMPPSPPVTKTLSVDARAIATEVRIHDIRDVASRVVVQLADTRTVHQKQRLAVYSTFDCALVRLLWDAQCPAIEVAGAKAQQKVLLGPQRLLAKVPVQNTIRAVRMKVFMRPDRRLLLLLLRFDELASVKDDDNEAMPTAARLSGEKKATRQGVSFECAELAIEAHEPLSAESASRSVYHAVVQSLEVKSVVSKSVEMSESMALFVHSLQHSSSHAVAVGSPALVEQILGVEASVNADSLTLLYVKTPLVSFQQLEIQVAMTDVVRATPAVKTTLFDFSGLARSCEVTIAGANAAGLAQLVSAVQGTFDTREAKSVGSDETASTDWRLRYVGNVDLGIQQLSVVAPYGEDASATALDFASTGLGERTLCVAIADFALNFRQFKKLAVQLSSLRVCLGDSGDSVAKLTAEPQLQLLHVPRLNIEATVYWKDAIASCDSAGVLVASGAQEFAVSCELRLKRKTRATTTTHVPAHEEALLALNWDYVFPLLVHFLADDDDGSASSTDDGEEAAAAAGLRCIGVQWDVSLDAFQVAFWDSATKDVGLLLVTNDLLSHGLAKNAATRRHGCNDSASHSAWVVQEATTFVDQTRAYVLRNAVSPDDFGESTVVDRELLPFDRTKSSNFFFEATGTSYREIRCVDKSPGADDDDDDDDDDGRELELLFSITCAASLPERVHDSFKPIDFGFSLFGSTRLRKGNSLVSVAPLSIAIPPSPPRPPPAGVGTNSTTTASPSPTPKSPRPWAPTVRAKLMKLKQRSSSMDNLLLNDGSCPIQVDSMKLLWTIETRDAVFYMTSLTIDSLQRLADATSSQRERQPSEADSATARRLSSTPRKAHDSRSPTTASQDAPEALPSTSPGRLRRGSTRDTLLDLLQQGKLGMKQRVSALDNEAALRSGNDGGPRLPPSAFGDAEEMHACKVIARKQYTLDIHDAQINLREDASQSSVLVATKHIHLEVGLDELRTHTVARLKFDSVTAHVAPIDVDISAGVLWYAQAAASPAHASPPRAAPAGSCLLQQVLDECSVTTTYSQALATGATAVEVDLSFLQLSTDRHQFYQLLSVTRHVLLAPPTVVRRQRRPPAHATPARSLASDPGLEPDGAGDALVFPPSPSPSVASLLSSKKLYAQVMEELRSRETKQLHARVSATPLKLISFRAAGTRFRLRLSPESTGADHEFVEIRAEGVAGAHTYFSSQSTKLVLTLQWMEVTNLRPGPSSIAFDDAMAVLKAKLLVDKRLQGGAGGPSPSQKGMLTVRAESGPLIRVLGQKLRVLDVLEVSVFPEVANVIVIQLAADFYELVDKFFFEPIGAAEHQDVSSEHVLFGRKSGTSSVPLSPSVRPGRGGAASAAPGTPLSPSSAPHPWRKSAQLSSSATPGGALAVDPSASLGSATSAASPLEGSALEEDDASADGCELFYFKYVRVGNVRLRINCHGFFVNLSDFDLELPPYVCQGRLCTWKKLLQRFESHLKWHVTKESASSGLSHFKNKFLKWTPSAAAAADKRDKSRRDDDDITVINAHVLFGPYSGAAT